MGRVYVNNRAFDYVIHLNHTVISGGGHGKTHVPNKKIMEGSKYDYPSSVEIEDFISWKLRRDNFLYFPDVWDRYGAPSGKHDDPWKYFDELHAKQREAGDA